MRKSPEKVALSLASVALSGTFAATFFIDIREYQIIIGSGFAVIAALIAYASATRGTRLQEEENVRALYMARLPIGLKIMSSLDEMSKILMQICFTESKVPPDKFVAVVKKLETHGI